MQTERRKSDKRICFANRHMTPEEYALWDVSRQISHQTGILYFDGRDMAAQFEGTSKSRIYRLAKRLLDKEWYELIAPAVRDRRTGLFSSTQYRVLSGEEWAKRHPHDCVESLEAAVLKFQRELIDWNMNFVRIWQVMSADERKALEDWEQANLDGHSVATSDWPGWQGKMPPRPQPPAAKHAKSSTNPVLTMGQDSTGPQIGTGAISRSGASPQNGNDQSSKRE